MFKCVLLGGALALALSSTALAQAPAASGVPYTNGPVWTYSYIDVKPGQFDNYMRYLSGNWRRSQEVAKRMGDVLDYKVMAVDSPRANEPDLILAVQWKNMAVFDRSPDEVEAAMTQALSLSPEQRSQGSIDRESMRSNVGGMTVRELKFK
jgi:hypothetical protein